MITTTPTIVRSNSIVYGHRLDDTQCRTRIPVIAGQAVTISAEREFGSAWSTVVLAIRRVIAGAPAAFASAKTIAAGGGSVTVSSSEMSGVDEIEVGYSSGAAEAAGTTATIRVSIETPVQAVSASVTPLNRTIVGLGDLVSPPSE